MSISMSVNTVYICINIRTSNTYISKGYATTVIVLWCCVYSGLKCVCVVVVLKQPHKSSPCWPCDWPVTLIGLPCNWLLSWLSCIRANQVHDEGFNRELAEAKYRKHERFFWVFTSKALGVPKWVRAKAVKETLPWCRGNVLKFPIPTSCSPT